MKMKRSLVPWLLIVAVAAAVRLPTLTAGLPYITYVDEGHVLHHVVHHLSVPTWEPSTYSYPTLPFYLVAGAAMVWSPAYEALHGRPLRAALSPSPWVYYDIVEPADLLVIGRLVTLAFSLGIVILTGLLARRLAGPAAGLFAAWLAALTPALVARSAIVNINPIVAFFALAALWFAEEARDGERPRRAAILAGVMTGLTGASKYPGALICLPVALAILLSRAPWKEKIRRLFLAGGATIAALFLAMPALVLRPEGVLGGLREMSLVYGVQEGGSYWEQAIRRAEWGLPLQHPEVGIVFLILAGAGLVVGLRDPRWSRTVWAWALFGVAIGLLVAPYKFRAFRNLLSLVPLGCMLVALLYAALRRRMKKPVWLDAAAVLLPILLFAPAHHQYIKYQLELEDSREQAIRWLAGRAGPEDKVLVAAEIAFLPARVASLESETEVLRWGQAKKRIYDGHYHYAILGEIVGLRGGMKIGSTARALLAKNYQVAARFGEHQTYSYGGVFRGNQQVIHILKRKSRPDRVRKPGAPPPRGAARRSAAP
jgi:Dolichyl-phosphate-mannose-protein mannosyltransferase